MASTIIPSEEIHISKDKIRLDLIENHLKKYMELENVDLIESSFLAFLVDTLATLSSNLLFYQSSVYREFFLTTAQLPNSIFNLSKFLGYTPKEATPAETSLLVSIPLEFQDDNVYFKIPRYDIAANKLFKFIAGDIHFISTNDIEVFIENQTGSNPTAKIKYTDEFGKTLSKAGVINTDKRILYFTVPVKQLEYKQYEYQVDSTLRSFQFYDITVPVTDHVASIDVQIKEPGSNQYITWTKYDSIYLMDSNTRGYIVQRLENSRKLFFGNDLLGKQPKPGSTILVTIGLTKGKAGNVIKGTINRGDTIYHSEITINGITYNASVGTNKTKVVSYTVTNPNSAQFGDDEESLESIRRNALNNLTASQRLVSENDFNNLSSILPDIDSNLLRNTVPILKKSDTRINEIQLYNVLYYNDKIIPIRNLYHTTLASDEKIERFKIITDVDDPSRQYYSLFDIEWHEEEFVPNVNSHMADYVYYIDSFTQTPVIENAYNPTNYNIQPINFSIVTDRSTKKATITFEYYSSEKDNNHTLNPFIDGTDHLRIYCDMTIVENGQTLSMNRIKDSYTVNIAQNASSVITVNESILSTTPSSGYLELTNGATVKYFKYKSLNTTLKQFTLENGVTLDQDYSGFTLKVITNNYKFILENLDKERFEQGPITLAFSLFHPAISSTNPLIVATVSFTFKKDLSTVMKSNMTINGANVTIYDIPCIEKSYYDTLVTEGEKEQFEALVMQTFINSLNLDNYRLLTDFVNIKFTNTVGKIRNMAFNEIYKTITSRKLTAVPNPATVPGNYYIINGNETGTWKTGVPNSFYKDYIVTSDGTKWIFIEPKLDMVVSIPSESLKLTYSESGWLETSTYEIPFKIICDVYPKSTYTGDPLKLVNEVKQTLINAFKDRFGGDITIHRSEIIDVIHNVPDVSHVQLIEPRTSIFFNYNLRNLSQDDLLKYGPEYVYFNEDSIFVRVR
ncbi:MAG: hypothetical protein KatS3mg002_0264 [Candidatus Woesearchaeota archaeon]|nr:MAG: hypothetical protein KatS3mg002_0264 [Candidatus Woesearchaeota archaeon]